MVVLAETVVTDIHGRLQEQLMVVAVVVVLRVVPKVLAALAAAEMVAVSFLRRPQLRVLMVLAAVVVVGHIPQVQPVPVGLVQLY
jgi:hypothetical protein